MLYFIIGLFVIVLLIAVGNIHCSIKDFNDLKNGSTVYCRRCHTNDDYFRAKVRIDEKGDKFVGSEQITKWDFISGSVITEEQYTFSFD